MATAKEIRSQIKGIQNTAKITKAMEMVAASKMRKAQNRVLDGRDYIEGVQRVIGNLMQAHPEFKHPFLVEPEPKGRAAMVLITTDKGLCGALNVNTLKMALGIMQGKKDMEILSIGRRGALFMKRIGAPIVGSVEDVPDAPELTDIIGIAELAMQRYLEGMYDEVILVYSEFINTMTQRPKKIRLIPCPIPEEKTRTGYWDYIYEPDSREVLNGLLRRYVEALIYHGVIENKASEQSARMVAMKNATENALEIVKELRLTYNKARQAAITKEISEIVSGAAATQ